MIFWPVRVIDYTFEGSCHAGDVVLSKTNAGQGKDEPATCATARATAS